MATNGSLLQVTVASCNNLEDTEWISRQDPYVCVEYGNGRSRTRTCTDGSRNPSFQEKFVYTQIEGIRELSVNVWNSNTLHRDNFIGSGKVQLAKALSQGFDDSTWPLQTTTGRHAGQIRLIIQYTNAIEPASSEALPYGAPQVSLYSAPPPHQLVPYPPPTFVAPYPPTGGYPAPSPYPSYPLNLASYPPAGGYPTPFPYPSYPPNLAYPPQPYGSQYQKYPPQPYGSQYPSGPPNPGRYPLPY